MTDANTWLVSLDDIRKRNSELMDVDLAAEPSPVPEILNFIEDVAKAGGFLEAPDERAAAQNILDFWNASILAIGSAEAGEKTPTELEPFEESSHDWNAPPSENPFLDLRASGRDKRALLFGRGDAIRDLLGRVRQHPIVFVTGPAGSGRTTLVMAGVVPRLKKNSDQPRCVLSVSSPGEHPLGALADVIARAGVVDLRRSPELFRTKVEEVCGDRGALLVVDKVGDLFTHCSDQQTRDKFVEAIASLVAEPYRHSAILMVRDEWAESIFKLRALKPYAVPAARFSPPPPTAAEIRRVLLALAEGARLRIDPRVVEDLAGDLHGDIAALPLARFMLLHLWPLRKGGFIAWDAYRQLGRCNDVLDKAAEDTYQGLSPEGQVAARRLFMALTKPAVSPPAYSQRKSRKTLDGDGSDAAMSEAIEAFKLAGLLKKSAPAGDKDDSLVIIHDRLMFQWKRLVEWLDEERQNSAQHLQVLASMKLWNESGRLPGYLFADDAAINQAESYVDSSPDSPALHEFLKASRDAVAEAKHRQIEAKQREIEAYQREAEAKQGEIAAQQREIEARQREAEANRRKLEAQQSAAKNKNIALALTVGLVVLLFAFITTLFYYRSQEQGLIGQDVADLQKLSELQRENDLSAKPNDGTQELQFENQIRNKLNHVQWLEYFGSADVDLSNVRLRNLNLHDLWYDNLHLVGTTIRNVNLSSAKYDSRDLANAAFSESTILNSQFNRANLSFSQFQRAVLQVVDFSEAYLYHANFEGAHLCDVTFTGAYLRYATFWNTYFGGKTAETLGQSTWWLARGWNAQQVGELLSRLHPDVSKLYSFTFDKERATTHWKDAQRAKDDFARVLALNDLAWTLTIYGVDLLSSKREDCGNSGGIAQTSQQNEIPQSAQESSVRAICLIDQLRKEANDNNKYDDYRLTFEDTLGYIYLQSSQSDRNLLGLALGHLQTATNNGSADAPRDALFRLAVAENALGRTQDALTHMKWSIDKDYVPIHERALLPEYLGRNDDFGTELSRALAAKYPQRENSQKCPE
jgi:uncharacterized protein YjbI with pentapeptide repeats